MTGALTLQLLPSGTPHTFDGSKPVTVGRGEQVDVVVPDPRTSRMHGVLRPGADGRWLFEDRSSSGTYRDGTRISQLAVTGPVVLHLGHPSLGAQLRLTPAPAPVGAVPTAGSTAAAGVVRPPGAGPADPTGAGAGPMPVGGLSQPPPRPPGSRPAPFPEPGRFTNLYEPTARVRIGRADDNDIVVPDLLVSRHHAELRSPGPGQFEIVDLNSNNGVFVDGERVTRRAPLHEGSLVSLGHHLFRLWEGRLEEYIDSGEVSFAARALQVRAGDRLLLDGVSFALEAGQFLAVLGPTGAGKSTLLKALIGSRPADEGQVLYNGRDLYASYVELRDRIAYVPQDDLLHQQLTVRGALSYAAQLRFPPDVPQIDRERRVEEVMAELGLTERADVVVNRLSGGQRKRTSVAIELLTRPSLLVLDEPTSGLDPGYEKSVMELLRALANGGRTVITVTHSVQSLDLCDRVLFLAPGGQTAYFGPPGEALRYFNLPQFADVFLALDRAQPGYAKAAFLGSAAEHEYVERPLGHTASAAPGPVEAPAAGNRSGWLHQVVTLTRRYVSVIAADRRNTALLVLQAPILGLLMLAVLGSNHLNVANPSAKLGAGSTLVALVLGATYLGAGNSIREIVKERPILTRERAIGISASAYVLSKAIVLGALTVLQAVLLTFFGILRQDGPGHGALLPSGHLELYIVVSLTGLAAMGLGLLISAVVANADKALTVLPVVLLAQFLLTGALFDLGHTPGLNQIAYATSARWGYSAAASSADLDIIEQKGCNGTPTPPGGTPPNAKCDGTHAHSAGTWVLDTGALIVLIGLTLGGAWSAVRPLGQPRRR
jgi:ABC-type multidrug transport system ATPase subunit/pSer/pThr/pTyr-binding forkhead associated (FHA) protein